MRSGTVTPRTASSKESVASVSTSWPLALAALPPRRAGRRRPGAAAGGAAAEQTAEDVPQPAGARPAGAAGRGLAEQVVQVEVLPAAGEPAGSSTREPTRESAAGPGAEQPAGIVVLGAPLDVGEHVVGLGDLLE